MKININRTFKVLGKTQALFKPNSTEPYLLLDAIIEALQAPDDNVTGVEKMNRWKLANRIYNDWTNGKEEIDLTTEEISKIKDLIGKGFPSSVVVGQSWEYLEGE